MIKNSVCVALLTTYFITSLLKKHSIKDDEKLSFCSPIIPVLVPIFFDKILYLYYQIVGLLKTCQKMFLTIIDHNKLFDGSYPAVGRGKCLKSTLLVISHQGCHIKSFPTKSR